MPKVTLEFNLPEDQYEFDLATNAAKYERALSAITKGLRAKRKYGSIGETTWAEVEEYVWSAIREEGISEL